GLDVGDFGGTDDAGDVEVAFGGRRRPDADGLVGQLEVGCVAVGLAEYRDYLNAHVLARANHAEGNLTAVGDQDALKHSLRALLRPRCRSEQTGSRNKPPACSRRALPL